MQGVLDAIGAVEWTEQGLIGGLGVLLTAVVGIFGAHRAFRGKRGENENAREQVKSEAMSEALSSNLALNTYVDGKIEAAVAPLRAEIVTLKEQAETVKGGFREHVLEVTWWDRSGRIGGLPQVRTDMLTLLGLSHLIDPGARLSSLDDTVPGTPD